MREKRVRTVWRVRRRYRRLWRGGAAIGVAMAILFVIPGWADALTAGALGPRRIVEGLAVIALAGWAPYAFFRWLWQREKSRHYTEWGL